MVSLVLSHCGYQDADSTDLLGWEEATKEDVSDDSFQRDDSLLRGFFASYTESKALKALVTVSDEPS